MKNIKTVGIKCTVEKGIKALKTQVTLNPNVTNLRAERMQCVHSSPIQDSYKEQTTSLKEVKQFQICMK